MSNASDLYLKPLIEHALTLEESQQCKSAKEGKRAILRRKIKVVKMCFISNL